MARKFWLFIVFYVLYVVLLVSVGIPWLNHTLIDKASPFNGTSGSTVATIASIIVFGVPVIIFLIDFYRVPKWEKEVQETGKLAPALVLELKDTGIRTGGSSRTGSGTAYLRAKLQVQPTDDAPFEAIIEKTAGKFAHAQPGTTINVKYDPNNKRHVVLAQTSGADANVPGFGFSAGVAPAVNNWQGNKIPGDVAQMINAAVQQAEKQGGGTAFNVSNAWIAEQQLKTLTELHQRGVITDMEFEAAKKRLLP